MDKVRLRDRARYLFDSSLSRGTAAMIGWLGAASLVVIAAISLIVWLSGAAPDEAEVSGDARGFLHLMWMGLMRTLDAGTMGSDKGSYFYLLAMLAFTMGGIFVVGTLIGLLTSGIEGKIEELRKGRSPVLEDGHVLILGWSSKIYTILAELGQANASQSRLSVVIMAEKDKIEMEDELRERVSLPKNARVICRTGSPIDIGDLTLVRPDRARTIVIVTPEDDDPDAQVVKVLLALLHDPTQREAAAPIVAELSSPKNAQVARMIGGGRVEVIESSGLIARIMVQTCRQSGLSAVYSDLLDFGGQEIYFRAEPALSGKTFGDCLMAYEDSAVLGVRRAGGRVELKPPMSALVAGGDQLILLAEDDSAIRFDGVVEADIDARAFREPTPRPAAPERTLLLGWNSRGPLAVAELDRYVAKGSLLSIVADLGDPGANLAAASFKPKNLEITVERGDTTDRNVLDRLDVPSFDHVILLCYADELDPQRADARTLISLLHLRDIAEKSGRRFSVVSELLDERDRQLAEITRADDFIVSDRLVSLLMSQVAENRELNAVFADIFDPEGAEIYLKPVSDYVSLGEPVSFRTLIAAARKRGEVAMGYRRAAQSGDAANSYGVILAPKKSAKLTFNEGDRLIVLAES
jgi:ion channel POLLUX/CASTOR